MRHKAKLKWHIFDSE